MKKSELENGMIVELRNGDKYMVIKDYTNKRLINIVTKDVLLEINGNGYMSLDTYTDNLLRPSRDETAVNYDIIKVYYIEWLGKPTKGLKLLWKREEKTDYIEVLKYLSNVYKSFVGVEQINNGYRFEVYANNPNEPVIVFIDKQKLEKSKLNEVVKLLEKELDKGIVRLFKV